MRAKKKSLSIAPMEEKPLTIEDVRLARKYCVMEIALLAAACRGDSAADRIEDAIQLLSEVELHTFADKWEKVSTWQKSLGQTGDIEAEKELAAKHKRLSATVEQICRNADKDEASGKIIRTSLAGLAYEASGIGKDKAQANRLYNDWMKEAMDIEAGGPSMSSMRQPPNPS